MKLPVVAAIAVIAYLFAGPIGVAAAFLLLAYTTKKKK